MEDKRHSNQTLYYTQQFKEIYASTTNCLDVTCQEAVDGDEVKDNFVPHYILKFI
jgi:hypothetical protein